MNFDTFLCICALYNFYNSINWNIILYYSKTIICRETNFLWL